MAVACFFAYVFGWYLNKTPILTTVFQKTKMSARFIRNAKKFAVKSIKYRLETINKDLIVL